MLRNYRRLFAAAATVAVAGTIAVTGITAASAAPRTSPAIAVTEHFQLVTTNPSSSTAQSLFIEPEPDFLARPS